MNQRLADLRRDYGDRGFDLGDAHDDPVQQFQQWFTDAREAEIYEPNGMALATVSSDGSPSCRTVLLKHVVDGEFVFFTDYTSQKGREIEARPQVALLFWWDRIHRQVRVEGNAERVAECVSEEYFASRPVGSRRSANASAQSQIVASREVLERAVEEVTVRFGDDPPRPPHWGGFRVQPSLFEFWQGRTSRLHDRIQYVPNESGGWTKRRLSP